MVLEVRMVRVGLLFLDLVGLEAGLRMTCLVGFMADLATSDGS